MKNLLSIGLALLSLAATAQTKNNRLGVAAGGGQQFYKGDLGNGLKGEKDGTRRGTFIFQASYYVNPSFDAGLFGAVGDLGYCQYDEVSQTPVDESQQCPGCGERVGLGNLSCRIAAGGAFVKYKFNNGYLLKENSMRQPYILAGGALNHAMDRMKMNCVAPGNYFTLNGGAGVRYYVTKRIHLNYQLAAGYFTNDGIDFMSHGSNDMYIQNTLLLGIDLL